MSDLLNRMSLLEKLERVKYEKPSGKDRVQLDQMSLAGALLAIAGIDHEHELAQCQTISKHLQGKVPQPDPEDVAEGERLESENPAGMDAADPSDSPRSA